MSSHEARYSTSMPGVLLIKGQCNRQVAVSTWTQLMNNKLPRFRFFHGFRLIEMGFVCLQVNWQLTVCVFAVWIVRQTINLSKIFNNCWWTDWGISEYDLHLQSDCYFCSPVFFCSRSYSEDVLHLEQGLHFHLRLRRSPLLSRSCLTPRLHT